MTLEILEDIEKWRQGYARWRGDAGGAQDLKGYPFVRNRRAPFTPARRALPMLNLGLVTAAGAYIEGTDPFDIEAPDGDFSFREIPSEIEGADLKFAARDYDLQAVEQDVNVQVPLVRLFEFESNGIIGQLNPVFWSLSSSIEDAARLTEETLPNLVERVGRYEVQAALLVPASALGHQSVSLIARGLELAGIPTMTLAVLKEIVESVRPPRAALHAGALGSVAGKPGWPEHQRRILDEALRLIEPMDQAGIRRLTVTLQSQVQKERGER